MMPPVLAVLLRLSETPAGAPISPFEVNFGLFFWTWLVFLALLFLLKKFAWPQIIGAVEAREKRLAEQIAETARLQEEAKRLVEQNQKALADGTRAGPGAPGRGQGAVRAGADGGSGADKGGAG